MVVVWSKSDGFNMGQLKPGEDPIMGVARINNHISSLKTPETSPEKKHRKRKSVSFTPETVNNEIKNSAKRYKQAVDAKIAALELGDQKTPDGDEDTQMSPIA